MLKRFSEFLFRIRNPQGIFYNRILLMTLPVAFHSGSIANRGGPVHTEYAVQSVPL